MKKIVFITAIFITLNVASQNVGIGTNNPAFKLDVNGNLNIKGDSTIYMYGSKIFSIKGSNNLFVGIGSGSSITSGSYNTAIGLNALHVNTSGSYNTSTGYNALSSNTTGSYNLAEGSQSLQNNVSGNQNTAIGLNALFSNTSGGTNTALGMYSLYSNNTGTVNTSVGYKTLYSNTSGVSNTGIGMWANFYSTTANGNTALGLSAGDNYSNGNYNTFVGYNAYANAAAYSNSSVLGYNTTMSASNQMRFGNTSITSIGGQVGWSTISDARVKRNIQKNVPGLDFILKLHPVTYNIDVATTDKLLHQDEIKLHDGQTAPVVTQEELNARDAKSKIVYSGFIAQDVEAIAKSVGYDFSGVDVPKNDKDLYGIRYAEFVVPLVKAIQEQQIMIEQLKKEIELLKQK